MSVDYTPRLGLPRWSAGTDPFTRAQMNAAHQQLDDFAGIDVQVDTVGNRPPASIGRGVYCAVMDSGAVFRSDGAAWHVVSASSVALATSPPGAESFGVAGAVGTSNALARADHRHAMPAHDGPAHAGVSVSALAAPTGALAMGGHRITNTGEPTLSSDAASKAYVDAKAAESGWSAWTSAGITIHPSTTVGGTSYPISGSLTYRLNTKAGIVNIAGSLTLLAGLGTDLVGSVTAFTVEPEIRWRELSRINAPQASNNVDSTGEISPVLYIQGTNIRSRQYRVWGGGPNNPGWHTYSVDRYLPLAT